MTSRRSSLSALFALLTLFGCDACAREVAGPRPLARVDGTPITEAELQRALRETYGSKAGSVSADTRRKVLESLIATRAMALAAKKALRASELAEAEREVQAYRDQRLIDLYIETHAPPEPVSDAMVEAYYREHLEEMTGQALRTYELLASEHGAKGEARAALGAAFAKAGAVSDWQKLEADLVKRGHALKLERGQLPSANVERDVAAVIETLAPGQSSQPFFVRERIFVARVIQMERKRSPSLAEMAPMIQRTLASKKREEAWHRAVDKAQQASEIVRRSP